MNQPDIDGSASENARLFVRAHRHQKIGAYTLGKRLGSGATSDVHEATGPAGELVAIKLLRPGMEAECRAQERFWRESLLSSSLDHPNLVRTLDFGSHEDRQYLVMERLSGRSVADLLAEQPHGLPVADLLRICRCAAEGLKVLHDANLVHRDVKPSNLLLAQDGAIKLGDFGLMRGVVDTSMLTLAGSILGTPHFMAPEQAHGGEVDARADIYGLAATMYMLATGRATCAGTTPWSVLDHLLREPFPDPRAIRVDLPEGLAAIIRRAGAHPLADRYQDVRSLIADLDTCERTRVATVAPKLPAPLKAPTAPTPTPATPDSDLSATKRHLLLIDDDPIIRRIYSARLATDGFTVSTAGSAAEARALLAKGAQPCLVLLDLVLPDGDGVELLREMRKLPATSRIPILVLSNVYDGRRLEEATAAGASLIAGKANCTPNRLLVDICKLLDVQVQVPVTSEPSAASSPGEIAEGPHFAALAAAGLQRMQVLVDRLAHPSDPDVRRSMLNELASCMRGLSGSAAALYKPAAAALAAAVEALAVHLHDAGVPVEPATRRTLVQALTRLHQLINDRPRWQLNPRTPPVLLVDDDPISLRLMNAAVTRAGLKAATAYDALVALELLHQQDFALIISDVIMPGMSGEQFVKELRQLPKHAATAVIYVTSLKRFTVPEGSVGIDYIVKPYIGIELTVKMLTAIAGKVPIAPPPRDVWDGI